MGQAKPLFPLVLGPIEAELLALLATARRIDETDLAPGPDLGSDELTLMAQRIYESRRDRDRFFDCELFAEPAWDMLLAAYWLPSAKRALTVSGLCYASAAPPSTGLRWIENLVKLGMLRRRPSTHDRRVTDVSLTPETRSLMSAYLSRVGARLYRNSERQPTGVTGA